MYLEQAQSLLENFAWIAAATNHVGSGAIGLWDEADGFFYDVLRRPDGSSVPLKVRSIVGLMPLAAATVVGSQMTNQVFAATWGGRTGREPAEEFWPTVIAELRSLHPETVLVAEAYWDMEWTLQQQGFDFCYDKRLYDRIVGRDVSGVRDHLRADLDYQSRLVRFLENHDEPRIAGRLPGDAERAAAVAVATLPGATLWHDGQFEGRRVRPPVFLSRRPAEPLDPGLAGWHRRLLAAVASHRVRSGAWRLLEATGRPDNDSCRNLLAWSWTADEGGSRHVVVVNLSGEPAQGRLPLGWRDLPGRDWRLTDILMKDVFERDGNEMAGPGLFMALGPWQFHLLAMEERR